ncbi:MAG: hypothetical protein OEV06_11530, partial [Anaerolineae bacterium]|nr:hypothetical protein [Anaerolineae bacterium]
CDLLFVHSSNYLEDRGVDAYKDEIAYFHSIANELRAKHYPSAPIMDDFSCRVIPSLGLR